MKQNYLPSKKFIYLIVVVLVLGIVIFLASNYFSKKNRYSAENKDASLAVSKLTLDDLLQKDSDGDGVMDWEEALWGTDPNKKATFDNIPDALYIKNKRAELKLGDGTNGGDKTLTETDKFSQEFFASLLAMKQNGQIDPTTINNVSSALGQKLTDPTLIDKYSEKDIKIDKGEDNIDSQTKYYNSLKTLFEKYTKAGLGDEFEIVSNTVASDTNSPIDPNSSKKLVDISNAYQEFSQKMLSIPVPASLATYQVDIANNANNISVAVSSMAKVVDDPVVGLSGLSQYQKYSDAFLTSVGDLQKILSNNGIVI